MPHPPIGVAGVSERSPTLSLAGERGWMPASINLMPSRIIKFHWEEVVGKMRRLYVEVGGFGVLPTMEHEWDPGGNWLKSMTLLKQVVMPMLDDLD